MYLIESIFKKFSDIAVGNKDIIKMLVTTVHPDEVRNASLLFFFVFFFGPQPWPEGSYKIGSVPPSVLPSDLPSVRKLSRDWLISFF